MFKYLILILFLLFYPFYLKEISILPKNLDKPEIIRNAIITCYISLPKHTDSTPFLTANNQKVRKGIIANNFYSFGTRVQVEGKIYEVQDRMNKRYDKNYWDIWMETEKECKEWGKKVLNIILIESVENK